MTTNTNSAQERAASIDLDKLTRYDANIPMGRMQACSDGDYFKVDDVRALARLPLTSGAPALIQALEVGDERESSNWFEIHPSEVPFYKDEGYSIRELYAAPVSAGAAAKTEKAPMEYRTCCDHPDCTTCAGRCGFFRLSGTYQWLTRSARAGFPEVREAALTMMAYYQGAEFPEDSAAGAGSEQPLPPLPRNYGRFNVNGPDEHRIRGWTSEQMQEYGRACYALARAPLPEQGDISQSAPADAWVYECLQPGGLGIWAEFFSRNLPSVANFIRNVRPLTYADRAATIAGAQDGQAVDDARNAARYRVLREHVSPAAVRISMRTIPPQDQSCEERIDTLCDQLVDGRAAMSASRPDDKGEHHG